jgi:asparagine synthase (glutamine-hydrolysing)
MPLREKIRGMKGKWLLRSVARQLLPTAITERRKWGFKVPTAEWFRGPLQGLLRHILLSKAALERGYFKEACLRRLVEEHRAGRQDHDKQLWILLQLELWHLMFIDRTLSPSDRLA